jgi:ABC-type glutathione transport system ATPase component
VSIRSKKHLSVKIDKVTADEIEAIERHLRADPEARHMMRHYDDGFSRGQVVRWAISRTAASLPKKAVGG